MRNACHHPSTRHIDEIFLPHAPKINRARAAHSNGIKISIKIIIDVQIRREVIRRATANDSDRQENIVPHHEIHNLMHRAITTGRDNAIRCGLTNKFMKMVVMPKRTIWNHHAVALLKFLDDPV